MAREMAEEAIAGLSESVKDANEGFAESMDEMLASWEKSGNTYTKEILVHSTLWGDDYDRVNVAGYKDYEMSPITLETDLSEGRLETLSSLAIHGLIGEAQEEVKEHSEAIFGDGAENKGEYGEHIGDAPVTVEAPNPDKEQSQMFVDAGSGELGRIMRDYIYYSNKEQQGWTLANAAPWEKPLWDDRGSFMDAPSLRSVANIGMTIVGAIAAPITGGTSLMASIALNVADDAVFGALDVAGGYKSIEQAGLDFGKAVLTTAATSVINVGFSGYAPLADGTVKFAGLMGNVTKGGLGEVLGKTLVTGMQSVTSTAVTSAINSFEFDADGKFGFNRDAFGSSMRGGLISAVGGMASTFTSGLMGQANLGDVLGFNKTQIGDIGKLNTFVGGLAGQGVQYAMGGDFTMNLLNFDMFGINDTNGNLVSQGLFELRFGRDGISAGIGMGGMDASFGAIASAINGIAAWNTNSHIQDYTKNNEFKSAIALRSQYGYGDETQVDQLFDILNGDAQLVLGSEDGYGAQTISGTGGRTVYLDGYRDGMTEGEQFALGVLLGHEAYRDGMDNGSLGQQLETQGAARGHTEMLIRMLMEEQNVTMNGNLENDLKAYFQGGDAFNNYVDANYDSSADYWKLVKTEDGKWDWEEDGSLDFNFDMKDSEIAEAFFGTIFKSKTGFTINEDGTATIKFGDMNAETAWQLGANLEIPNPLGSKIPLGNTGRNLDLDEFGYNTLGKMATSTTIMNQIVDYMAKTGQLSENGVKYGYDKDQYDANYIMKANATMMDCIGLLSYLTQTPATHDVANFANNPLFEQVDIAMPGDFIAFIANNGIKDNNHIVGWLGAYGKDSGISDQIFESADKYGPRFSTLSQLTGYYDLNNYTYTQLIYRLKGGW
jgi:hypothetical protein